MYPSRLRTNPEPTPRCSGGGDGFPSEKGPKKSPNGLFSPNGFPGKLPDPKATFFTFLTTWILTTPGRTVSASSLKFAGTMGTSADFDGGVAPASGVFTTFDIPYPVPSKTLTRTGASKYRLRLLVSIMSLLLALWAHRPLILRQYTSI